MYAKIYESIFDSSIAEDYQVRHIFEDLLKLANQDGEVDRTLESIARRTNVPIEIVTRAIQELEKPDLNSRNRTEEGRRLVRLDLDRSWGWRIVNHGYYRNLKTAQERREADRLRQQAYRNGETQQGYVYYVAESMAATTVKIGFSKNPWSRLAELQISNTKFQIVAIEPGTFKTEKERHRSYDDLRRDGEWFDFKGDLRAFITTLVTTSDIERQPVTPAYASASVPGKGVQGKGVSIPTNLNTAEFQSAWERWREHRREMKKPLTETCINTQFKFLAKYPPEEAVRIIETSIRNSWQGLFEPRPKPGIQKYEPIL